ncbi:myrosinase 1-like [Cydia pomonella]|uniref:myrosinase 1-like n=1 Tax=Cydia pomonella TaxID=82600 RepID=UPI002ADD7580|nr:myrosinase 1-like [Cydia pomonella]
MCFRAVVIFLALTRALEVACLKTFPPGFRFGAASAAYQIEGGWNVSDKGESIWDHIVHTRPGFIADLSTGDVACDSYHLWEEDLKILEDLGVDFYRFSISWPRLLPSGFPNHISEDGCRYYSNLIDGLLARGIAPVVTLYHWDLPQNLQDLGGWTNPLVVEWFADYARVVYSLFADRVKTWITINEPCFVCDGAYRDIIAPGIEDYEIGALLCTKYVLLAHAAAYRIYEREFKHKYGGEVSITNQEIWLEPKTEADWELTLLAREYAFGRYTYPVFSAEGGWPPALEAYMAEKSAKEGYPRSRLPAFTPEEIQLIKGSSDFFGLNHYTSRTVRAPAPGERPGLYMFESFEEVGAVLESKPEWAGDGSDWLKVNPEGLRHNLNWTRQLYGDVRILIIENGCSSEDTLNDTGRVSYIRDYLEQVLLAIDDGIKVIGYTAWSLMDDFEWIDGYQTRFGLHAVDFSDPRRARTARASASYYRRVLRTRAARGDHTEL